MKTHSQLINNYIPDALLSYLEPELPSSMDVCCLCI